MFTRIPKNDVNKPNDVGIIGLLYGLDPTWIPISHTWPMWPNETATLKIIQKCSLYARIKHVNDEHIENLSVP